MSSEQPNPNSFLNFSMLASSRKLLILVGSQTGCSQEVAEGIARRSRLLLWQVSLSSLDECERSSFIDSPLVVIVCSTTGQGDIPDNCKVLSLLNLY
jgi:sulfite reductase alpha subunit-like flavoprotein